MNNNKLNEQKINKIIKETIDEYVDGFNKNEEDDDNSIQIGGLDLSAMSPFEIIKR